MRKQGRRQESAGNGGSQHLGTERLSWELLPVSLLLPKHHHPARHETCSPDTAGKAVLALPSDLCVPSSSTKELNLISPSY